MASENRHNKILHLSLVAAFYLSLANATKVGYDQHDNGNPGGIITRCDAPGTNGYFVSRDRYPYSGAAAACKALGGSLADLSNQSFLFGADMLLTCAGPETKAWIGSWDYSGSDKDETSDQNCLSIHVGSIGPGGGIDRACAGDKHVICQVHPSSTPHNSLYSEVKPAQRQSQSPIPVHNARSHDVISGTSHGRGYPQPYVPYPYPYVNPNPYPYPYNGGYPGGIYPGGPGYGNGGYPYGYPGKGGYGGSHGGKGYNGKDKNNGSNGIATVYQTVTLQGIITTVTIGGVERTVTVAVPAATVTNNIIQTVVLPSEPITITKMVNGLPVTVTALVEPATVTLTGKVVTATETLAGQITTKTETLLQQLPAVIVTEKATETLLEQLPASTITQKTTTTQVFTERPPPNTVTRDIVQTVVIPSEPITITKIVDGVPVTVTALVEPATVTLTGRVVTATETLAGQITTKTETLLQQLPASIVTQKTTETLVQQLPASIITQKTTETLLQQLPAVIVTQKATETLLEQLPASTITQKTTTTQVFTERPPPNTVTRDIVQTVVIPSEPITITKIIDGIPVTVTARVEPATVTLTGKVVTATETLPGQITTRTQIVEQPVTRTVTLIGQIPTTTVTNIQKTTETITNIQKTTQFVTNTEKVTQTIIASTNSRGQTMYNYGGGFNLPVIIPNFNGAGTYDLGSGIVIQVRADGSYAYLMGGPTTTPTSDGGGGGGSITLPFNIPNFTGPGTYTLGPSSTVVINGDGSYSFINGGGPVITPTSGGGGGGGSITLPFNIPNFTGPGTYTLGPSSTVVINGDGSYSFINGGGSATATASSGGSGGSGGSVTFNFPFPIPGFQGPGIYLIQPEGLIEVFSDGSYSYLVSPKTRVGPTSTVPANVPTYTGAGSYTVGPKNSVVVMNQSTFSFINSGNNQEQSGYAYVVDGVSYKFPFLVNNFNGPGIYTINPEGLIQVNPDGSWSYLVSPMTRTGPTTTLPPNVPTYTGPGTYSLGPSSAAIYDGKSFSVIQGGSEGSFSFSYNYNGVSFSFPFQINNFAGPGIYAISPDGVIQVNADGTYNYLISPKTRVGPTSTLPASVPTYTGPGTYSIGSNSAALYDGKTFSVIQGGSGGSFSYSYNFNGVSFSFPFQINNFRGPGVYALSPDGLIQVNADGSWSYLVSPKTRTGATTTLPPNVPTYTGPGTYSLSPSSAVIYDGIAFSFINGGGGGNNGGSFSYNYNYNGISFNFPFQINNFAGPGIYALSPDGVIQVNTDGSYSYLISPKTRAGPTSTLPPNVPTYTGPGTYSIGPSSVAVYDGKSFSFINGGGGGNGGSFSFTYNFNGISFSFPFQINNFAGPGVYALSPDGLIQVNADGSYIYLISPKTRVGPTSTLPANIPTYTGAGTYSIGPSSAVIYDGKSFSFINGGNGGSFSYSYNFNGISFSFPFQINNFAGPGVYALSPDGLVRINLDGSYTYIISPKTRVGPTSTLPVNIPTYTGAGTYSIGPSSAVIYDGKSFSFINGGNGGSFSYSYNFNGISFSFPFQINNFAGPGVYALSPDGLVRINLDGSYTYIISPKTRVGPTSTLPANIPTYTGAGTYSIGPSSAVIYDGKSFSFINGGNGGSFSYSYNFNGISYSFPFQINNFAGPGVYVLSPDGLVRINLDGTYTYIISPKSRAGPTSTLPANIPTYTGAGTYSIGPSSSVAYDGITYSFITGGSSGFSYTINGQTFRFPFSIDGFSGPGYYLLKPDGLIQVLADGSYIYIVSPRTRVGPTSTLPANIPTFTGVGTYSLGPSTSVAVNSQTFSFITATSTVGYGYVIGGKLYRFPFAIEGFTGPGYYLLKPDGLVQVNADGSYTYIVSPKSRAGATSTLPAYIPTYTGPGSYTLGPGGSSVVVVNDNTFSFVTTSASSDFSYTIGGKSFTFPFAIPGFYGPGVYILGPNLVIQVNNDGTFTYLSGGPSFTITKSSSTTTQAITTPTPTPTPTSTPTQVTLPTVTYPSIELPFNGGRVSSYTGDGVYSLNQNTVVVISDGRYSYIRGNGLFVPRSGSLTIPPFSFPTLSLGFGFNIPNFTGPGIYTLSPGNVVSVNAVGGFTWIQGGPGSNQPQVSFSQGFSFPSLTLPSVTLPTLNLGSFTISGFTGAGIYTPSPGNIISLGAEGRISVLQASGTAFGSAGATLSISGFTLPQLNFPTVTLPGGFVINGYTGPGAYTVGTGTVVSVAFGGGVRFIQGSPEGTATANLNGNGFTFPTLSFPTFSAPSFSFPAFTFPSFSLPFFGNVATESFIAAEASASNSLGSGSTILASDSVVAVRAANSEGFVLPGFSLSGFTRRVVTAASSLSASEAKPSVGTD